MFGFFRKRKGDRNEPDGALPPAPGWDAITQAFERLYPGQKPRHWKPGGTARQHDLRQAPHNPLDGVSVYDAGSHWHYVGFGMSDLYEKTSVGTTSGLGHELTFRLAKEKAKAEPPRWPIPVLVSLARAEFAGELLAPGHTIKTGPIDGQPETRLTALLIVEDRGIAPLDTPHGRVAFLQLVGVDGELRERALREGSEALIEELRGRDPDLVTRI
jgi:hypothetical protein